MERNNNFPTSLRKSKTLDICQVALMAAIVFMTTWFIHVPSFTNMGVVHIGDSMIFTAAILFSRKKAVAASALGMALFDILSGYAIWSPFTLVIKGMMAFITVLIAYRKDYKGNNILNNILAFVIAGIWMIVAYYFAGVAVSHFAFNMDAVKSFIVPLSDIFGNVLEVTVGIIIAVPLSKAIKEGLKKARINLN
jgi:uncharacterized membrane protein